MADVEGWYSVRLVSRSLPDEARLAHPLLFEDRIILVRARSDEQARIKALESARREDTSVETVSGRRVRWQTDEVLEVCTLLDDVISDGSEVYHAYLSESALEEVRQSLRAQL